MHIIQISRRHFLHVTALVGAAGASLLVGCSTEPVATPPAPSQLPPATPAPTAAPLPSGPFAPSAWLQIDPDDTIRIWIAKSEMGQGISTALPMLVAEELEADWSRVRVEQAPADFAKYGDQLTAGSTSVMSSYFPLRRAGALARELLISAAAQVWGVPREECRARSSVVLHMPSGRALGYGALAGTAATLPAPEPSSLRLKEPREFQLIGTRTPRLDIPAKVDGSAVFGLDVRLPGMRFAVIARCPVFGGKLLGFDSTEAERVPGVLQVLVVDSGVAVVAETTWAAIEGRRALRLRWDEGPNARQTSAQIAAALAGAAAPRSLPTPGAPEGRLEAVYTLPLQAHVPMEPLNCTALVCDGCCEVWAPTQDPQGARAAAQRASKLPTDQVIIHTTLMGGGFGRRSHSDFVEEAVQVAQMFGGPVQVVWTREDDIQHGRYQPCAHHYLSARLDAKGLPSGWRHLIASEVAGGGIANGAQLRYSVGAQNTPIQMQPSGVPVGPWRSVAFYHNIFAIESFIDELAALGGADPLELRRRLLGRDAAMLAVLDLAAKRAGWGRALPAGHGRGLAVCAYDRTRAALVLEASVAPDGTVRVERAVCAIDCGVVVNPDGVEAQIEGAIVFGLTAALKGAITIAGGRVEQSNFHDYPLLRLPETPRIEVAIIASDREPSGAGEPGVPLVAPALANALFAATGQRVRSLPVRLEARG